MDMANSCWGRSDARTDTATTVPVLSTMDNTPKALRMATSTPRSRMTLSRSIRLT